MKTNWTENKKRCGIMFGSRFGSRLGSRLGEAFEY